METHSPENFPSIYFELLDLPDCLKEKAAIQGLRSVNVPSAFTIKIRRDKGFVQASMSSDYYLAESFYQLKSGYGELGDSRSQKQAEIVTRKYASWNSLYKYIWNLCYVWRGWMPVEAFFCLAADRHPDDSSLLHKRPTHHQTRQNSPATGSHVNFVLHDTEREAWIPQCLGVLSAY